MSLQVKVFELTLDTRKATPSRPFTTRCWLSSARGDRIGDGSSTRPTATAEFVVEDPKCNLPFLSRLLANEQFRSGAYDTGLVAEMPDRPT